MKQNKTTTAFILDKRREKLNGMYPVKLRVIHNRQNQLYGTSYSFTEEDFNKIFGEKPRGDFKNYQIDLNAIEAKADAIIKKLKVFSFDAFKKEFFDKKIKSADVFSYFQSYIDELLKSERIGNAIAYRCAMKSFKEFYNNDKLLLFEEVDVRFLKDYERWATNVKKYSVATKGIYFRCLRTLYNYAIKSKDVEKELYPFGKDKFEIQSAENINKALKFEDVKRIYHYIPVNEIECFHRDLWLFSFLCNGANIKDICLLKYSNIQGDTIKFIREKTKNTCKNTKEIPVSYTEPMRKIVERWGNKTINKESYIFSIIKPDDNELRIKSKVNDLVSQINKYMNRVRENLQIDFKVTTYTARHSFANTLREKNFNLTSIKEVMGHSAIQTTITYMNSIDGDEIKEIGKSIINF